MQLAQAYQVIVALLCIWSVSMSSARLLAANKSQIPVRHLVKQNDTLYSNMTNGICPYVYSTSRGVNCGVNQRTNGDTARIDLDVIGKFDEQAYDDFNQLEKKPSEDLIRRIFAERSFNSASGTVKLSSYFRESHISFTPVRYVQAYFITNPVAPEVHYVRAIDSLFSIQHTFQISAGGWSSQFPPGQFLFSVKPWVIKRERAYLDADFTDLIIKSNPRKKTSSTHQDVDILARYIPGTPWFRGVSLSGKNLNSGRHCSGCGDALLDIDVDSRRSYGASADFGGRLPIGGFLLGIGAESQVEDGIKLPFRFNLAASYNLTSFGFYASFNETITRIGFLYEGDLYRSGIVYTNEKQVNMLRFARKNEAFLIVGFTL